MSEIRIRTRLESDTPHLPQLRAMVGKDVEITVTDEVSTAKPETDFWHGKSIQQLAEEQRISGPTDWQQMLGGWPDSADDGFEQALDQWRQEGFSRRDPE